jgi:hypothetical protein
MASAVLFNEDTVRQSRNLKSSLISLTISPVSPRQLASLSYDDSDRGRVGLRATLLRTQYSVLSTRLALRYSTQYSDLRPHRVRRENKITVLGM